MPTACLMGGNEGRIYPAQETYALCRCGRSQQTPYCDGSHAHVEFDGTETAPDTPYSEQAAEIDGPELRLTDAELYCAGAGFCRRDGGTWALTRRSADPQAKQTAIEEACECPSGRLIAWEVEGPVEPEFEPSIGLVDDAGPGNMGPIWLQGRNPDRIIRREDVRGQEPGHIVPLRPQPEQALLRR